jgi:hypothetical protein
MPRLGGLPSPPVAVRCRRPAAAELDGERRATRGPPLSFAPAGPSGCEADRITWLRFTAAAAAAAVPVPAAAAVVPVPAAAARAAVLRLRRRRPRVPSSSLPSSLPLLLPTPFFSLSAFLIHLPLLASLKSGGRKKITEVSLVGARPALPDPPIQTARSCSLALPARTSCSLSPRLPACSLFLLALSLPALSLSSCSLSLLLLALSSCSLPAGRGSPRPSPRPRLLFPSR